MYNFDKMYILLGNKREKKAFVNTDGCLQNVNKYYL